MKKIIFLVVVSLIAFGVFAFPGTHEAQAATAKTPTITKLLSTDSYVQITWKKVSGSSKYYVYRKTTKGKYQKIATVSKNKQTYKDKKIKTGKAYVYRIVSQKGKKTFACKGRQITPAKITQPKIQSLSYYTVGNKKRALFKWKGASKCSYYNVYRKTKNGSYTRIAQVKASAKNEYSYTDNTCKAGTEYTYTVRGIRKIGTINYKWSQYDKTGVTTITEKVTPTADMQNLQAYISWKATKTKVNGYKIIRKIGLDGTYRVIGTVKDKTSGKKSYTDIYYNSMTNDAEKKMMTATNYIDLSTNNLVYSVRPYIQKNGKVSYGDYYNDGDYSLTEPVIVKVDNPTGTSATLDWCTVSHATKYKILVSSNGFSWTTAATVNASSKVRQIATITTPPNQTYYAVQAVAIKNGSTIYSGYDKNFNIANRNYSDKSILYIGDSITFGSPYYGDQTVEVFSYPWRVNQLLGVDYYNPSISGATYSAQHSGGDSSRYHLITDVAEKIKNGTTPTNALHPNSRTYKDFDVVVLAAGTNDYLDETPLGDINSTDIQTFNGAVNTIMGYIQEANTERAAAKKAPIQVVFVDLFYSDRTLHYSERTNRFITPNQLGLTLTDYQDALNAIYEKYQASGMDMYKFKTDTLVTNLTCPYLTTDNLHMTKLCYSQIGDALARFLLNSGALNATYKAQAAETEEYNKVLKKPAAENKIAIPLPADDPVPAKEADETPTAPTDVTAPADNTAVQEEPGIVQETPTEPENQPISPEAADSSAEPNIQESISALENTENSAESNKE